MKIVQLVKGFYIGGTEVQVIELCRGLAARHEVKAAVLDRVGAFLPDVESLNLELPEFPLRGSFTSPNTARQVVALARYLKRTRADVLHAHDFYSTLLGVPAAKLARVKVVVSRLDLLHWHGRARGLALQALTRVADHVIANAEAVRDFCLRNERLAEAKISVVRNGLDLARFDARFHAPSVKELPPRDGLFNVVHVANLVHPVKRQEDGIRALAASRSRDLRLVLVGDGPRRRELEALAKAQGVFDRVMFLGYRTDVPAILSRCDAGLLCSTSEGLSNAVMEGMAARLPMVVTDAGGNPELVKDGDRGFVVPARAPERIAERLLLLDKSRELGRRLGNAGRAFVETELSLANLVRGHEAIYERVASAEA